MKGLKPCRLALLLKVGWFKGRVVGGEGGKMIENNIFGYVAGERRWTVGLNFEFCFWNTAL